MPNLASELFDLDGLVVSERVFGADGHAEVSFGEDLDVEGRGLAIERPVGRALGEDGQVEVPARIARTSAGVVPSRSVAAA